MKEFRLFFAVILLMLVAMCFSYHSRLMPLLLLTALIVFLFSFITGVLSYLCFSVKVENPTVRSVNRQDEVILKISIENSFLIPLTPVRIYVSACEKGVWLPQKNMLIVDVPPFKEVTLNIQNVMSFRGEYQIGFEKAEIFDILKIFRFKITQNEPWTVVSYPRKIGIDFLKDDNQEDTDVSRTKLHGFNKDVFSHLREYREGESLRHIHWKLSAQVDGLIVKQMEANYDYSALVFCDFVFRADVQKSEKRESFSTESFLEASDAIIETAMAIVRKIVSDGNSASVIWQDLRHKSQKDRFSENGGSAAMLINNEHDCKVLTDTFALLPAEPFDGGFTDLLDDYKVEFHHEREIYILTAAVTEDLVEKLRTSGLLFRRNVVMVVIKSELNQTQLVDYLRNEMQISVIYIEV